MPDYLYTLIDWKYAKGLELTKIYGNPLSLSFSLLQNLDAFALDNTPRSGYNGIVLEGSTPELYRRWLESAIKKVEDREPEHKLIFLKSWNEWAEGNYLEPDSQYGHAYLQATLEAVKT